MAETIAITPRLRLRTWRADDFSEWCLALNTDAVKAHFGGPISPELARERFDGLLVRWHRDGEGPLAVVLREGGAFLGSAGFHRIVTSAAPAIMRNNYEIGYEFRGEAWGKGYASEAARAVAAMVFDDLDRDTVYAQTSQANRRSWQVMQRIGMTRRVDLDYDDPDYPPHENPTMVWSLNRPEQG